jgi:hypothetical protein
MSAKPISSIGFSASNCMKAWMMRSRSLPLRGAGLFGAAALFDAEREREALAGLRREGLRTMSVTPAQVA